MLTREIAISTATDFLSQCAAQGIVFKKAILFGSTVRGNVHEGSDIDLLLVSDQFGKSIWENAKLIAPINKKFTLIEAHPYPTAYFLKGDPFISEVRKTGVELAV